MKLSTKFNRNERKRAPLWKWIIILVLVIAMPLFFSFYRTSTLRMTINSMPAASKP